MTEQQKHLQSVIQQGQELAEAINQLNAQINDKRAMLTKLQGVAEYLNQIGVKLPEEGAEEEAAAPEVVAPTEVVEEGE
jgi:prefoldin subunit 5|tara:strand:- start:31 stop:267 length:237 start_codon:yes stop_codon:yes gene_type:complete